MAIVQISRITHRKGLYENLPQLAGGELGWAIDDRRLFIGNGTLADGAPVIGNTEILTEFSDVLNLAASYTYKGEVVSPLDSTSKALTIVQTGSTSTNAVTRSLQSKLDDFASVKDFGAVGDGVVDDTAAINRALYQLHCRETNEETRRGLFFPAGVYLVTGTINVPSYARLHGEGPESSIIRYTSPDSSLDTAVMRTADSLQQVGVDIATNGAVIPSHIEFMSLSVECSDQMDIMLIEKATDCYFDNVCFRGNLTTAELGDAFEDTAAIRIASSTGLVTEHITINNCHTVGTTYGLHIDYNCKGINLTNSLLDVHYRGVVLGETPLNDGPTGVRIVGNMFDSIRNEGIYIGDIASNISAHNIFYDVGNGFNGAGNPVTPVISINNANNLSLGDLFERSDADALQFARIELNDLGGIALNSGKSIRLGNYERSVGLITTLPDNTSAATAVSHEVLDDDLISGFVIDYSIKRGNTARNGTIRVCPDYSAGTTPTYSDDYDEFGSTGVVLSITQSVDKLYLKYTTTSTGTDATLNYSIVKYII